MLSAADCVRTTLSANRTEAKFQEIYSQAKEMIIMLNIQPITMPHIRSPPKCFISNITTAHAPTSPEEHYRADFFKMLDTVDIQLKGEVWSGWSESTCKAGGCPSNWGDGHCCGGPVSWIKSCNWTWLCSNTYTQPLQRPQLFCRISCLKSVAFSA